MSLGSQFLADLLSSIPDVILSFELFDVVRLPSQSLIELGIDLKAEFGLSLSRTGKLVYRNAENRVVDSSNGHKYRLSIGATLVSIITLQISLGRSVLPSSFHPSRSTWHRRQKSFNPWSTIRCTFKHLFIITDHIF